MVAPYEIGEPVRSFIRVGIGSDALTKPICWDLSRSSTVTRTLPPASPITTLSNPTQSNTKEQNDQEARNNSSTELVSSEVLKLIKERDQLREENSELQKRLSLFHDLFKNKRRLTMFVNKLTQAK